MTSPAPKKNCNQLAALYYYIMGRSYHSGGSKIDYIYIHEAVHNISILLYHYLTCFINTLTIIQV